jgi:hypothetical protein
MYPSEDYGARPHGHVIPKRGACSAFRSVTDCHPISQFYAPTDCGRIIDDQAIAMMDRQSGTYPGLGPQFDTAQHLGIYAVNNN